MNKTVFLSIFLLYGVLTFGQKDLKFSQFPARVVYKTAAKVDLKSHAEAKFYRTNLRNALANSEVNFAGNYILASWGCGSGCTQGAIIDVRTGNVFFPKELQGVYAGGLALGEHEMLEYKKNSSLLVIYGYAGSGFESETATHHGIYYYLWTGKTFKLLKFIVKEVE